MRIDISSPVTLNAGLTPAANGAFGMAPVMGLETSNAYTNGNGPNQNYSNAAVALELGGASNVPFTGAIFQPRVWNGTIYYNLIPGPSALVLLTIAGLALVRRR